MPPRRLVILGPYRSGTRWLLTLLRCSQDISLGHTEPLATMAGVADASDSAPPPSSPRGSLCSLKRLCDLFDSLEKDAATSGRPSKWIGVRVSPAQLLEHGITVRQLCSEAGVECVVVMNRPSVAQMLASRKLAAQSGVKYVTDGVPEGRQAVPRPRTSITPDELHAFHKQMQGEWEFVADGLPEFGRVIDTAPLAASEDEAACCEEAPDAARLLFFVDYDDVRQGDCTIVERVWRALGCDGSHEAVTPMRPQHPGPLEDKLSNYAELAGCHHLTVNAKSILLAQRTVDVGSEAAAAAAAAAAGGGGASQLRLLAMLSATVLAFHCLEAYFKERIFKLEGFHYVELLTVLQGLVVASIAVAELRASAPQEPGSPSALASPVAWLNHALGARSKCPFWVYMLLGGLMAGTQYLTNHAILQLSFVTQVVFKSSKLLWVMAARALFMRGDSRKRQSWGEWAGAVLVVGGLILMTVDTASAAKKGAGESGNLGLVYISCALVCDALIFIVEEHLAFDTYKASKQEVILFMQVLAIPPAIVMFLSSGKVQDSVDFLMRTSVFPLLVGICYACGYMGTRSILSLVQSFGSATAALVTSLRKIATIFLSFLLFPKPLTAQFVGAAACILLGAAFSALTKVAGLRS
eukprot:Rhum_TRINITY_DN14364_c9_g2::Rhum_TRINITY_DN14364_c9_g2_i1::g.85505::m.85505/K15277/SLC35B3, PAPST2; solute carrier family 35 (adenosine 3'-phospho 5'-phosphosulfate transporter), member B3